MSIITAKCPHCRIDNIRLDVVSGRVIDHPAGNGPNPFHLAVNMSCSNCGYPSCAVYTAGISDLMYFPAFQTEAAKALNEARDLAARGFRREALWPETPKPRIPEYLDPDAARALLQAERNFDIAGNEEAAATMYRRTLEVSLKKAFPSGPDNLSKHIKALVRDGKLTPTIGEWADHIREIGNEAIHETGQLSRADLIAMREFTDAVLRYAISLPAEIVARRRATLPEVPIDPSGDVQPAN